MTRKKIIGRIPAKFNLTRALVVRSRKNAGESFRKIAPFYGVTETALWLSDKHLQDYINRGLIEEPNAHKEDAK